MTFRKQRFPWLLWGTTISSFNQPFLAIWFCGGHSNSSGTPSFSPFHVSARPLRPAEACAGPARRCAPRRTWRPAGPSRSPGPGPPASRARRPLFSVSSVRVCQPPRGLGSCSKWEATNSPLGSPQVVWVLEKLTIFRGKLPLATTPPMQTINKGKLK